MAGLKGGLNFESYLFYFVLFNAKAGKLSSEIIKKTEVRIQNLESPTVFSVQVALLEGQT